MRTIQQYLSRKTTLDAWQLSSIRKESYELYANFQQIETMRCNTSMHYSILLHIAGKEKDTIGESRVAFQNAPGLWQTMVDETIERAALIDNPRYDLSHPWSLNSSENPIYDKEVAENSELQIKTVSEMLNKLSQEDLGGCFLVSYELFLNKYQSRLVNHLGLELRHPSTKVVFDYVLLSPDQKFEINGFTSRRFLSQLDIRATLIAEAKSLLDLQVARTPPTGSFPVVLSGDALDTLYDYFVSQADGSALYFSYSSFKQGEPVLPNQENSSDVKGRGKGRGIHISTDPHLKGGMGSGFYDGLGFPLKKLDIISDGILKNFTINGKFSKLLEMPGTTQLSTIVVGASQDAIAYEDFFEDGVIELLKFSTFTPNTITGAFSGEIRLGYIHKGGKKIAIRGGSVSGVTQEAFVGAKFSKELVERENYYGPRGVYFENLTLAGEDS